MGVSAATDLVRTYHEQTKHGGGSGRDRSRLRPFRPLDPATRPAPFKRYPQGSLVPLPTDVGASTVPAAAVLSGLASVAEPELDEALLARLLHHSVGVTRVSSSAEVQTWFRASMSAGNLHPVEVYVVCDDLGDLPAGVHHVAPLELGLTQLREGDWRAALAEATAMPELAEAPAALVLTGIPWRTAWKYGERGLRHLYWDAGAVLANLLAVAEAAGLPARVLTGFVDDDVAHLVGVVPPVEVPLAVVALGSSRRRAPGGGAGTSRPVDLRPEPLPAGAVELPLLVETQAAGDLATPAEVARWREVAAEQPTHETSRTLALPSTSSEKAIEDVILRRGSTRLMHREPVPNEVLSWALAVASRPPPLDGRPPGRTVLQHGVSVHAVDGMASGTYRGHGGHLELVRPGDERDQRDETSHLCLAQPLGGDAAYTVFHLAELSPLLEVAGARGYRVAQLEAGVAAGRLALASFALGAGATGLTFYDDEVSAFFETTAAALLVTAVGPPAYRSKAGGPPGHITELRSFDRLMLRLSSQLHK